MPTPEEAEVIRITKTEISNWQGGDVWVTDTFGFHMREIIKKARKNYLSQYDDSTDPQTGRKKVFVPFTEWTVDNVFKNIDIDTKDIKVTAKKPDAIGIAQLFRFVLNSYLDKANFGYTLNEMIKNGVCIDGTGFLKTWREGKDLYIKFIDRLNMIFDPSAEQLDDSSGIIERNILTIQEFKDEGLQNSEFVKGDKTIDRTSMANNMQGVINTEVPYVVAYERYGWIPEFCFSGNEEDKDTYTYALTVVSGIGGNEICHKIKRLKPNKHPYGMFKLKTIKNRGDGRGVPEMLFNLQAYLNEIVNIRLNVARISQSQLFKVYGNITPQQLTKLFQTGAIKMNSQTDDIIPIDTGTIDPSSYQDEDRIMGMGQRVTQTTREDEVTSSTPATNALIQERGAAKGYNQIVEGLFISLSQFLETKVLPLCNEIIKMEGVIKFTGNPGDLELMDDKFAKNLVYSQMESFKQQNGYYPLYTEEEMDAEIERVKQELKTMGNTRYLTLSEEDKGLFNTDYDIQIEPGEERINPSVESQQLIQLMGIMGQQGLPIDDMLVELFDLFGKDSSRLMEQIKMKKEQAQQMAQQQMMAQGGMEQTPAGMKPPTTNAPQGPVTQSANQMPTA